MLNNLSTGDVNDIFHAEKDARQALHDQAVSAIIANQECYVAQWILQHPFERMADYRLKFVYNDQSMTGYTVEMEKIDV